MQALAAAAGLAPPIVLADAARGLRRLASSPPGALRPRTRLREPAHAAARRRLVRAPARARAAAGTCRRSISASAPRATSRASRRRDRDGFVRRIAARAVAAPRGACRRRPGSCPATTTCIAATSLDDGARHPRHRLGVRGSRRPGRGPRGLRRLPRARRHGDRCAVRGLRRHERRASRRASRRSAWIFDCLWYGWNAAAAEEGSSPIPANSRASPARLLA